MVVRLSGAEEDRADEGADDHQQRAAPAAAPGRAAAPAATRPSAGEALRLPCAGVVSWLVTLQSLRSRRRERCRSSRPGVRRRRRRAASPARGRRSCRSSSSPLTTRIALPSRRMRSTTASSASFDLTSTPAVGSISTSTDGSLASARPITTFCWLPPERLETGWSGPSVIDAEPVDQPARDVAAPPRRDEAERAELVGDGHGGVVGDRLGQHQPLRRAGSSARSRRRAPAPPARCPSAAACR